MVVETMGQCVGKKRYGTLKNAQRGRMNLWGADPKADLSDLHVYKCPVCGHFHIGHKSKYKYWQSTLREDEKSKE